MNDQARSRTQTENNWKEIDTKFRKMLQKADNLKPGDGVMITNQRTNEIEFGRISYENNSWREVQIGSDFRVFSYYNHKFVRHN